MTSSEGISAATTERSALAESSNELLRAGLSRADSQGRARLPLKIYSATEQDEGLSLLHLLRTELVMKGADRTKARLPHAPALSARSRARTPDQSPPRYTVETLGKPLERSLLAPGEPDAADPARNREVELAAEREVSQHYEAARWVITRVAHLKCGWDLTVCRGAAKRHLEVKGVSSSMPSILLTRNELRRAERDHTWRLATVTSALTSPELQEYPRETVIAAADPALYRVNLSPA